MRNRTILMIFALVLAIGLVGCTTTQKGTVGGGALGAGAGAIIGHQSGHAGEGALIGAAVGAITGAIVGNEIDKNRQPEPSNRDTYETEYTEYQGSDYYEGDHSSDGRKWVPEHEEVRVYTAPDGSKYEKTVVVPGHYE